MFRVFFSKASAGQEEATKEMVWYRREKLSYAGEADPKCVEACRSVSIRIKNGAVNCMFEENVLDDQSEIEGIGSVREDKQCINRFTRARRITGSIHKGGMLSSSEWSVKNISHQTTMPPK
ncbi:hypothetical protein Pan241w_26750 [Gimesia alba]|uniref:Uncharacterized protein n=1 Tax=Gimesia alba TaxID=2527973 RepID=A0A517RFD2_9PLAN|nr:hypothetical protein Pan241w_26750 [Gimesia alba]